MSQILSTLSAMTTAGLVESPLAAAALAGERDLGYLAVQAPGSEGFWTDLKIEGTIPKELNGDLYRVAPGQKETFGVKLRHFFDGDAFVTKYQLRDGRATVRGRFVATPERSAELAESRMLFNEFGTLAPAPGRGGKNQPSINVIRWDGHLLALSEGGHPSALNLETLEFDRHWDFHGTLPRDVTFTAHPKIDPETGAGYAFGTHKGEDLALLVYRMELDGTLTQIAALPQPGYFMIHDMLLGGEHVAFVAPPVHYDLPSLFSGRFAAADTLRYRANDPTRVIVVRKDGTGTPLILDQPACMVFHHGNLCEAGSIITTDSLMTPDDSILRYVAAFSTGHAVTPQPTHLTRLTIDLGQRRITKREILGEAQEYPRFDARRSGQDVRYLYMLGNEDKFAMRSLFRHDFAAGKTIRADAEPGHALEEALFVPKPGKTAEADGWLLHQGYSAPRNETYLEIRDAATLERIARVWTGQHFPLGLHGNFYFES